MTPLERKVATAALRCQPAPNIQQLQSNLAQQLKDEDPANVQNIADQLISRGILNLNKVRAGFDQGGFDQAGFDNPEFVRYEKLVRRWLSDFAPGLGLGVPEFRGFKAQAATLNDIIGQLTVMVGE